MMRRSFVEDLRQLGFVDITGKSTLHLKSKNAEICMKFKQGDVIRLTDLSSSTPKAGHGTKLLKEVCALADSHQAILTLCALPFGDPSTIIGKTKLVDWYRRFGFHINYDCYDTVDFSEGVEMIRFPKMSSRGNY